MLPYFKGGVMHQSASYLSEKSRKAVIETLNASLADGIDLYTQIKVAHWNIKGPHFASLHSFFDSLASEINCINDEIAERAVILGGTAFGTARHVAKLSTLPDYDHGACEDLKHVKLLAERLTSYAKSLRKTQEAAEKQGDTNTVDILTAALTKVEMKAWFLLATLG